jgi:hypothetical protein
VLPCIVIAEMHDETGKPFSLTLTSLQSIPLTYMHLQYFDLKIVGTAFITTYHT